MASLKPKVDDLYLDKVKTVPAGISKLSNDVVKNTVYDKLITKVKTIDTKIPSTRGLVTETQYDSDK